MKKKTFLLVGLVISLIASGVWAQEEEEKKPLGITVGQYLNFDNVLAEERDYTELVFQPYAIYSKSLDVGPGKLSLRGAANVGFFFGGGKAYGATYPDKDGEEQKFMLGMMFYDHSNGLEERVGYQIQAGPGKLSFSLRNRNGFTFTPANDYDDRFGLGGDLYPYFLYNLPVEAVGDFTFRLGYRWYYANAMMLKEDYHGRMYTDADVNWDSKFGLNVEANLRLLLNDYYNGNKVPKYKDTHVNLFVLILGYTPPSFDKLHTSVEFDCGLMHPDKEKDNDTNWVKENGISIIPDISYDFFPHFNAGVSLDFEYVFANNDKDDGNPVMLIPMLYCSYSF